MGFPLATFHRDNGPLAFIEGSRDVRGKAEIEGNSELVTAFVNAITDRAFAAEDDGLDLKDVGAHVATIADAAGLGH